MMKTYEGHEIFYKRMRKKGIRSWNEYQHIKAVDAGTKRFLNDALAQPWAPKNSFKLLRKGGLFIVMTMCSPVNRRILSNVWDGQKLIKHTLYTPWDTASKFEDYVTINGRAYLPTRKVPHWKSILSEIQRAGFKIKLLQYNEASGPKDHFGGLSVAALA